MFVAAGSEPAPVRTFGIYVQKIGRGPSFHVQSWSMAIYELDYDIQRGPMPNPSTELTREAHGIFP
jgi:hypothetical protein